MRYLWLPFLFLPLAELVVFIAMADAIGFFSALAWCILMGILGIYLVQREGLEAFLRAQDSLRDGKMPFRDLFSGLCVVMAGFLLIFPGFISDFLALLLLLPDLREKLRRVLAPRMARQPGDPSVIEGEFERVDPQPTDRLRP